MISIDFYDRTIGEGPVEIVERKGIGHPDTICDAVVEAIALEVAQTYENLFGEILHFNIDKALLAAGKVEKGFGWGNVVKPITLYIGDRATFFAGGREIDINGLVASTAKSWFLEHLPHLNVEQDITIISVLSQGSQELTDIFSRKKAFYPANDTSAAVGYYPLSETERVVLKTEEFLNSKTFKKANPDTGQDVKVMALRRQRNLELTIAMPLLARQIKSESHYFSRKEELEAELINFLLQFEAFKVIKVNFNALDRRRRGLNGVYLSLTGTSAEDADSGEVGRGNRVNGIISVVRPIGTEAAAGKNPVSHVGKIYNVFAHHLAKKVYESIEEIKEVYVFMLSEIGKPVDKPKIVSIKAACKRAVKKGSLDTAVKALIMKELKKIKEFCTELSRSRHRIY